MKNDPLFYSDKILAAAYRGKSTSERTLLTHIVASEDIVFGRLKRQAGEPLCNKSINVCGQFGDVEKADCPRCKEIYFSFHQGV